MGLIFVIMATGGWFAANICLILLLNRKSIELAVKKLVAMVGAISFLFGVLIGMLGVVVLWWPK